MKWVIPAAELTPADRSRVGGKAYMLSLLDKGGFAIPKTLCIPIEAYSAYIDQTGLRERIQAELFRKDFSEMRWEEMWDCALRIRHMVSKKPLPEEMAEEISSAVTAAFGDRPVALRSSAADEDTAAHSFAGIHESYINIKGADEILTHLRKVWASLWSDAALLYRREIGLDVQTSAMAVVIQEVINGECSGIVFTRNPADKRQAVVEAVHGLNQALVDGAVEPDRWIFDRKTKKMVTHTAAKREQWMRPAGTGVLLEDLPSAKTGMPPLDMEDAAGVFLNSLSIESFFQAPQDIEWTRDHHSLVFLQARPITAASEKGAGDDRAWYLSLRRTYDNLRALWTKIETELVPGMIDAAEKLAETDLAAFSTDALAEEIKRRKAVYDKWHAVYWADFIPFAHGMRLFGEIYNDIIQPEDPYEFVNILSAGELMSLDRNRHLETLSNMVRSNPSLADALKIGDESSFPREFAEVLADFNHRFGDVSCGMTDASGCQPDPGMMYRLLLNMAEKPSAERPSGPSASTPAERASQFVALFPGAGSVSAQDLLDLARASYRMRDDDNIYLGRIEARLYAAVNEGKDRLAGASGPTDNPGTQALKDALKEVATHEKPAQEVSAGAVEGHIRPRQLRGQPAGPGFARGTARVVLTVADLENFKPGDIMVCDAVEPNMTFIVPLVGAIVERRGGMLIHGAIIAREYGLPCVTGISGATRVIRTGDRITVDGYLGIVTIMSGD
ncbi:MAG: PEP/pyruvate-binding domain-containing protein [Desulfobacterales bacterium]|nr:PEP/pyruvate-binding domain-containing protein [Desulfobacterales bacterium]